MGSKRDQRHDCRFNACANSEHRQKSGFHQAYVFLLELIRDSADRTVTSRPHCHHDHTELDAQTRQNDKLEKICMFLQSHFGEAEIGVSKPKGEDSVERPAIFVHVDDMTAVVDGETLVSRKISLCAIILFRW
jgi:hypothetical protein